jgi:activator of HSP90 ATPase
MLEGRRQILLGGALGLGATAILPAGAVAEGTDEVSRTAESIHQERFFKATRRRVYPALTVQQQFDQVARMSAAMQSAGMARSPRRSEIVQHVGGAFALFGAYITGRQIELVPDELIVQAWRVGSWDPGVYSLARFKLLDTDGTRLIFDHTGFPTGQGEHLADGWQANYWTPLEKFLAGAS